MAPLLSGRKYRCSRSMHVAIRRGQESSSGAERGAQLTALHTNRRFLGLDCTRDYGASTRAHGEAVKPRRKMEHTAMLCASSACRAAVGIVGRLKLCSRRMAMRSVWKMSKVSKVAICVLCDSRWRFGVIVLWFMSSAEGTGTGERRETCRCLCVSSR